MGDPRKQRRKYERPPHLWKTVRITEENELCRKYGLKNKKEVWRAKSTVGRLREQARKLLSASDEEANREFAKIKAKLTRLGIMDASSVEDVLSLNVEHLLDRRLQTMVHKKNLANTINQARQLVTHGHVYVGSNVVSVPGYIVPKDEEDLIRIDEKIKVVNVGEGKAPVEGQA